MKLVLAILLLSTPAIATDLEDLEIEARRQRWATESQTRAIEDQTRAIENASWHNRVVEAEYEPRQVRCQYRPLLNADRTPFTLPGEAGNAPLYVKQCGDHYE